MGTSASARLNFHGLEPGPQRVEALYNAVLQWFSQGGRSADFVTLRGNGHRATDARFKGAHATLLKTGFAGLAGFELNVEGPTRRATRASRPSRSTGPSATPCSAACARPARPTTTPNPWWASRTSSTATATNRRSHPTPSTPAGRRCCAACASCATSARAATCRTCSSRCGTRRTPGRETGRWPRSDKVFVVTTRVAAAVEAWTQALVPDEVTGLGASWSLDSIATPRGAPLLQAGMGVHRLWWD